MAQDEFSAGVDPDMHWAPANDFCAPCQLFSHSTNGLTSVVHMETFGRDRDYVLKRAGLRGKVDTR